LGTQYHYRVRAHSSRSGFSAYSNTLSLTPQAASSSGGGGGGGCFIATAAYGSALHPKVNALRQLRDLYLMPNALGRAFVGAYSRLSPPLADFITRHDWVRAGVRTLLWPLVWLAEAIAPEAQAGAFFQPQKSTPASTEHADKAARELAAEQVAQRQLMVKFKPEVETSAANALLQAQGATRIETVAPQLYLAEFSTVASRTQAQTRLAGLALIEHVEINRVVRRPAPR